MEQFHNIAFQKSLASPKPEASFWEIITKTKMDCDHIIGTRETDGYEPPESLHISDLPNGGSLWKFHPYNFCPECGMRIKELAAARIAEIGIELQYPPVVTMTRRSPAQLFTQSD